MDRRAIRDGLVLLGASAGLGLRLATERIHPLGVIWPAVALGFLGIGAVLLVVSGLLSGPCAPPEAEARGRGRAATVTAALFVLLTLAYVAVIEWLGFLVATVAYALASQWLFRRPPRLVHVAVGLLVAVGVFVLFEWGLGVPLPPRLVLTLGL